MSFPTSLKANAIQIVEIFNYLQMKKKALESNSCEHYHNGFKAMRQKKTQRLIKMMIEKQ